MKEATKELYLRVTARDNGPGTVTILDGETGDEFDIEKLFVNMDEPSFNNELGNLISSYMDTLYNTEIRKPAPKRKYKKCPKCGAMSFVVTAHVTQDWVVDENGDFISPQNDCVEITHYPDDDDIWECNNCGFSAAGKEFVCEGE